MNIYNSELWLSDIDKVIEALPELQMFIGKSVMITGCTGLVCSAVADVLIRWNITHKEKIIIILAGRDSKKIEKRFLSFLKNNWVKIVFFDASAASNQFDFLCDYIIHGAGNAFPQIIVKEPVETIFDNIIGTKCLLDYARKYDVKRVLYISSSEVYGKKNGDQPWCESEYGFIDSLNSRSSYSISKRAAETLCISYFDEYDVDSVIVRPGHIYGPTATENDNRVSSLWAYAAARGEDIIMKSKGLQNRSYCYCLDCASAILSTLIKGKKAHAYNISNPDSIISIKKVAEILAKSAGVKIKIDIPIKEEKKGFNPMNNSSLDSAELLKLGWKGLFTAEQGFLHTVKILKEIMDMSE